MDEDLDNEWVDLVIDALELGITTDEIKDFLNKYQCRQEVQSDHL